MVSFVSAQQLTEWVERIGLVGPRHTASAAHTEIIDWLEDELRATPGLHVRSEPFSVLRWTAHRDGDLRAAGGLTILGADGSSISVGGAVPYSRPTEPGGQEGVLTYLPPSTPITAENALGRVVLRDFPQTPFSYAALGVGSFHVTADVPLAPDAVYDRPSFADDYLHADLLAAGAAGAAGVVFAFDLPREQVAGYFEPHKGTHYDVPAVFIGVDERASVLAGASDGKLARVTVRAEIDRAETRNVIATLPGKSAERIIVVTHSDGHTWVQENGGAALLALARHFAAQALESRERTLEFVLTSGHLHISREGTVHYASQLDESFDDDDIALVVALEHLGTREYVPVKRSREGGEGRELVATGEGEVMLWAVGPSKLLQDAVVAAVTTRELDKIVVGAGLGTPVPGRVPSVGSFGGIGTYFHQRLIPTTAIISGPWTLWAPTFGPDALDMRRLYRQVLAIADVVQAADAIPRGELAGQYLTDRVARERGVPTWISPPPPETAWPVLDTEPLS